MAILLPNIDDSSITIKKNYENCWFYYKKYHSRSKILISIEIIRNFAV